MAKKEKLENLELKEGSLAPFRKELRGQPRPLKPPSVRIRPHIGFLLNEAYDVLHIELERLKRAAQAQGLDPKEAQTFARHVDALAKLAREERFQDAEIKAESLSDEELEQELALVSGAEDD